jgi:hypothetical protein
MRPPPINRTASDIGVAPVPSIRMPLVSTRVDWVRLGVEPGFEQEVITRQNSIINAKVFFM